MFELKNEELKILASVVKLEKKGSRTASFYAIAADQSADTNKLIPIIERLQDDGFVSSSGLVFRYLHSTEKGREAVKNIA